MKTIIVATDYSERAETALKYAVLLARLTKAKIALLNIYSFNIHALNGLITPAAMDALIADNQTQLDEYCKKLSAKYEVPLSAYTRTSGDEETLDKFAKQIDAGLIVMGMRRDFEEQSLTGNISSAIISNTLLPVLVIPDGVNFKLPERLLYACDFQQLPGTEHLNSLKELATTFNAELQIFHVSQTPVAAGDSNLKQALVERIENSVGTLKHTYRDKNAKDIIEGIKQGLNEFKADILVMSPHRYGFWRSLFHKSKTREMALQSSVPLLSMPSGTIDEPVDAE